MPTHLFLQLWPRRWGGNIGFILLLISLVSVGAAEKRLAAGPGPDMVVRAKLAALDHVPGTNRLQLALSLPLRDPAGLSNLLAAIYNPASAVFHRYLTPAEFAARFGPAPAEYQAVIEFARTNGLTVTATHPNRLVLDVAGPAAAVEQAFRVQLKHYRHPQEARNFFAPDREPTVAATLPAFSVSGLDDFSRPHPNAQIRTNGLPPQASPRGGSSPGGGYMGNDFRQAYVPGTPLTGAGQNVGLLQFDGFYPADITNYMSLIGLTSNVPQLVVRPVNGGVATPGSGNFEVALDIEMVLSMAPGVGTIYVYEAPNPSPWVSLLSLMANDNLARQLSCSWGGGGPDAAAEQIFLQMAAQGQSFFNATGDSDAFVGAVEFPSESPHITQVGGTTLTTAGNGDYQSETVWNWGDGQGSSGGISTIVAIPLWQLGLDFPANHGSPLRRNIPDVALTADDVFVKYNNGQQGLAGGTSCAAPLWAGLTALINQQAEQLGQPPVGFMNPTLYAIARGTNYAAVFRDTTVGNNFNSLSPTNFSAVPGYDLCTGLGTPNGTNFINALTTRDELGIVPLASFAVSGRVGGPFAGTNISFTLTNAGDSSLDWAVNSAAAWVAAGPVNGTLAAHETATVTLVLGDLTAFPLGDYWADVAVTNLALSRVQMLRIKLAVLGLIQNGGFETGDFTGWQLVGDTISGNYYYNAVATDFDFPGLAHSGSYGVFLGQSGYLATLSQTLPTTPGQRYLVSCWLHNPLAASPQFFNASWDGTNYVSLNNPPVLAWTNIQFMAFATTTNTVLQFAAENDANYFGFDDVSVAPVPDVAFASLAADTNTFQLAWNSLAGLNYQVQYKTNLLQANWLDLDTVTAVTNVTSFVDTNFPGAAGQRFYRLVLLP